MAGLRLPATLLVRVASVPAVIVVEMDLVESARDRVYRGSTARPELQTTRPSEMRGCSLLLVLSAIDLGASLVRRLKSSISDAGPVLPPVLTFFTHTR